MTAAPTARIIDVATLRSRLDEDSPRILDVRTPAEFETVHIPGSYNVPLDLLREHRDELVRHIDEEVVLVCRSGARASRAEQALGRAGLPGLRVLDGGVNSWQRAGARSTAAARRGTSNARSASPSPRSPTPASSAWPWPECPGTAPPPASTPPERRRRRSSRARGNSRNTSADN